MFVEHRACVAQQTDALEDVVDDHWLEDVEFEVARCTADVDGDIVTKHLRGDHCHRLALRWVDLARHDRRTGFVFWNRELSQTAARTRRHPANVVRDLHTRCSKRLERSVEVHECIVCCKCFELVRRSHKRQRCKRRDGCSRTYSELRMGVNTRADGSATECEFVHAFERLLNALDVIRQRLHITREFLSECDWRSIHQVRTSALDEWCELSSLCSQCVAQCTYSWEQT